MKTKKISLATMQGKLSRTEMKNTMAGKSEVHGGQCDGSIGTWVGVCNIPEDCTTYCRSGKCHCY